MWRIIIFPVMTWYNGELWKNNNNKNPNPIKVVSKYIINFLSVYVCLIFVSSKVPSTTPTLQLKCLINFDWNSIKRRYFQSIKSMYKRTINKENIEEYLSDFDFVKNLIIIIKGTDNLKCIKIENLYLLMPKSKYTIENKNPSCKLA